MIAAPTQRRRPALAPLSFYLIYLQGALVAGRATPSSFFVSPPNCCGAILRHQGNSRAGAGRKHGLDSCAGGWNLRSSSRPADGRDAEEESADDGSSSFPGKLAAGSTAMLLFPPVCLCAQQPVLGLNFEDA